MKRYIKIIITTKSCDRKLAVIGFLRNGRLNISFSNLPELIVILTVEPFDAYEGEQCLRQLREKLSNFEGVTRYDSAIIYHNTSSHECVFGAQNEFDELKRAILERHYFIEYSLYDLI